ncbi:MAG: hypothetical protein Q8W44_03135 [Candidatus Palauibacterales bacterium]|nr:hypothetical protein [Candidatus Palauibacterales bacterium]
MSLMTVLYLVAAAVIVGGGIGLLAKMNAGKIAAQIGLMIVFALSFYGLVYLLM